VLLRFDPVSTQSEWTYFPEIAWREDSSGLYTVIPPARPYEPGGRTRYYFLPLEGEPVLLAEWTLATDSPLSAFFPLLAPDGLKVAYIQPEEGLLALHILDHRGTNRVVHREAPSPATGVTEPSLIVVGWAPDSRRIAFYNHQLKFWASDAEGNVIDLGEPADVCDLCDLRWVDSNRFLVVREGLLILRDLVSSSEQEIADAVTVYEFKQVP
ncbi:MAG: hypothetical protein RML46_13115, partial [Anaerolineae bacterium]|nr:hypothetical protein [Anaerolineae bacterium]